MEKKSTKTHSTKSNNNLSAWYFRSTSNKLLVIFESDSSVQKAGFSATFMKEFDECASIDHGCSHSCVNTLGGYECACDIGYELHSDGKKCESE